MYLAYYDESGDDGFPAYSSQLFVLTAIYMHHLDWKENYMNILAFRKAIHKDFNFPVKMEMHTKNFLLDKDPYRNLAISNDDRRRILVFFCYLIARLKLKIINTVVVKPRITTTEFDVLDRAFSYSIQRIENDVLSLKDPTERFQIITDPGRVTKMRKTARRLQRFNYIPSKYELSNYRREIKNLIEDPLPKDSKDSYYIQLADLVSYIITLYSIVNLGLGDLPNRLKKYMEFSDIMECMEILKEVFNTKATEKNEYGIVYSPSK